MAESWVKVGAAPDESIALLMDGVLKEAGIRATSSTLAFANISSMGPVFKSASLLHARQAVSFMK